MKIPLSWHPRKVTDTDIYINWHSAAPKSFRERTRKGLI